MALTTTPSAVPSTSTQSMMSSYILSLSEARVDPNVFSITAGRTSGRSLQMTTQTAVRNELACALDDEDSPGASDSTLSHERSQSLYTLLLSDDLGVCPPLLEQIRVPGNARNESG